MGARRIDEVLERVDVAGRSALLESEALELASAIGLRTPPTLRLGYDEAVDPARLAGLGGETVAVKVLAASVRHKTESGGVLRVPATVDDVDTALATLRSRFSRETTSGFVLQAWIGHPTDLAGELLVGWRRTDDFGPVVTIGPGGVWAEALTSCWRPGRAVAIVSPDTPPDRLETILRRADPCRLLCEPHRGSAPRSTFGALIELVRRLLDAAVDPRLRRVREIEFNPVIPDGSGWIALDGLATLDEALAPATVRPARSRDGLGRMLVPERIAFVGVSRGRNPGRVMLENTLRAGFPAERISIVKPGSGPIDGCRCYPDVASIPEPVDLAVLAVAAEQVPEQVEQWVARRKTSSLIVIPGGLGERAGSETIVERIRTTIDAAGQPQININGGNCLGIRSRPGRYDTLFLPAHKLPASLDRESPLALLSQSGAFAAARLSSLASLAPRYVITVGNQLDLTLGDWLEQLERDPAVRVVACYVEGFRPGDGSRWLGAARRMTEAGRTVVLCRAGRTVAGARASASHTASIAGDATVCCELATNAGVDVADSLESFEDLVSVACAFEDRDEPGPRVGLLSNAGFECVVAADALGPLTLAPLTPRTRERLSDLLADCGLSSIVDAANPLDITPMANDEQFVEAARRLLEDETVEIGVIGCVPLTPALRTLAESSTHEERCDASGAIGPRLVGLWNESRKPWVAVIDGGTDYDELATLLASAGIPVFRRIDRALAALGRRVARQRAC